MRELYLLENRRNPDKYIQTEKKIKENVFNFFSSLNTLPL